MLRLYLKCESAIDAKITAFALLLSADIHQILLLLVAERRRKITDALSQRQVWSNGTFTARLQRTGHSQRNTSVCSLQLERPQPGWWHTWKGAYKKMARRATEVARQETMSLVIQISRGSSWDFWQTYSRASGRPWAPELILLSCCRWSCGENWRHRKRTALARWSPDRSFNFKLLKKCNLFLIKYNLKEQSQATRWRSG